MSAFDPFIRTCALPVTCWTMFLCGALACFADEIPKSDLEFFEKDVRPLLIEHCYECHSGDEANGGLLLDSRAAVSKGGDTGVSLVPGEPEKSLLIEAITYENEDLRMPPSGRLQDSQIQVLRRWVKMGAPDPRVQTSNSGPAPTGMSIEEGRKFWSFKPLANPQVPNVESHDWIRTPIDAFVLRRLESQGLKPAPLADRETLIRRVTLDLIGLPPTPEETAAFIADESPDAFANLVERLLASPQYGVRWGRHWLDVARYADSNGLDENLAFGTAWKYRDYVVDAFNDDKPFDRFLIEQVAGDLVPHANQETKTATGFLVLGAKVLAEPDREKLKMDTIDEQLDAMGKAFLGMTFGCVRCHDHKFDPVKQTDYYALAAILKSTKTFADTRTGAIFHWNENVFATEEHLAAVKAVDKQIAEKKKAASNFKNKVIGEIRSEARSKATEYLVASTLFAPSASLNEVAHVAKQFEVHPRILHHCRRHLEFHRDDPVLGKWHELAKEGGEAVDRHYRTLFNAATQKPKVDAKVGSKVDSEAQLSEDEQRIQQEREQELKLVRNTINDTSGFLAVPPKVEYAFNDSQLAQYNTLMEQTRVFESAALDQDSAMGVADDAILDQLPIHIRGSHRNFGDPVSREFPMVMRTSAARPIFPANQSGRLELARWMASSQHPLTARVYANRIWRWHFGRGIVGTTENFGVLGDRPSHPDLLDWLARYLIRSGWSTKAMHRLILTSSVYQMSSSDHAAGNAADPENRLLWKFPLQRLDAEQIRDSMLAVSGRLDVKLEGKTVPLRNRQFVFNHTSVDHTKYDSLRRAAYLPVIRNNLYTLFEQFDFPDPTMPTGSRSATTVAPQALLMMNAHLVIDSANAFARNLMTDTGSGPARVELAYRRALGRTATADEESRALSFIDQITSRALTGSASIDPAEEHRAWALFCQSLFASNEFIYVR